MSAKTKVSSTKQTIVSVNPAGAKQATAEDTLAQAREVLAESLGIDSHIDTIQRVLVMSDDLGERHEAGHVDIPRLREGGMHAPFFAFWVPVFVRGAEAVRRTLDLRDAMQSVLDGGGMTLLRSFPRCALQRKADFSSKWLRIEFLRLTRGASACRME